MLLKHKLSKPHYPKGFDTHYILSKVFYSKKVRYVDFKQTFDSVRNDHVLLC